MYGIQIVLLEESYNKRLRKMKFGRLGVKKNLS